MKIHNCSRNSEFDGVHFPNLRYLDISFSSVQLLYKNPQLRATKINRPDRHMLYTMLNQQWIRILTIRPKDSNQVDIILYSDDNCKKISFRSIDLTLYDYLLKELIRKWIFIHESPISNYALFTR